MPQCGIYLAGAGDDPADVARVSNTTCAIRGSGRQRGRERHVEENEVMDEATPNLSAAPVAVQPCDGCAPVRFTPADIAQREVAHWTGIDAESIAMVRREPYEYRLQSQCHLLVMAEHAERDDGETQVEGLPPSSLRKFSGMLSFVPRGHRLSGWQKPRVLTRVTYFYIDPDGPLLDPALRFAETEFKPRLFFHDAELWAIAS